MATQESKSNNPLFEGMKMLNIKLLIVFVAAILFSTVTCFAQQSTSPQKKVLIQELRQLTESTTLSISVKPTSTKTTETYTAQIESDPQLTDVQKQELKTFIAESRERIDKQTQGFFADKQLMKQTTDEVGFQLYDENFTEDELRELIAFYRTPVGQKAAKFMPTVRTQLGNRFAEALEKKVRDFLKPKIREEVEQLEKMIREARGTKSKN